MAKLSKEQYERRNENAAKRMNDNKQVDSLIDEQHEAISRLCAARHEIHSNKDSMIKSDQYGRKSNLIRVNIEIEESGILPMNFIPTDLSDYIDIDDIDNLKEFESVDSDDEDYQNWYDENYSRISGELENLNSKIENYLREIDSKYGTNYAPTGAQRIF